MYNILFLFDSGVRVKKMKSVFLIGLCLVLAAQGDSTGDSTGTLEEVKSEQLYGTALLSYTTSHPAAPPLSECDPGYCKMICYDWAGGCSWKSGCPGCMAGCAITRARKGC